MAAKSIKTAIVPAKGRGRPPFQWTPEIEQYILNCVIANKSMRELEQMGIDEYGKGAFPCAASIKNYLASNSNFLANYTRAKDLSQDFMAEDLIDIIDGRHPDFRHEDLSQRKESAEIRKWVMGKLRRKKWGEVKITEVTGENGTPLIPPQILDTRSMTPEAQAALYQALQVIKAQSEAEDVTPTTGEDE